MIQSRIDKAIYHISQIEESLLDEFSYDIPEKPSRQQQIQDWIAIKSALETELAALDD